MAYTRTAAQKKFDFENARAFENAVSKVISKYRWTINKFLSVDDLDIYVPGYYIEIKEKNQQYTDRWTNLTPHIAESDLFIIDELTIRRALTKYPNVFFLLHDGPQDRLFVTPLWELTCLPATRVMRVGKGKRLYDMNDFHPLNEIEGIIEFAEKAIVDMRWLSSENVGPREVDQV